MSTLAVLQARMTSTRLPGKVLLPLAGEPSIIRQLERVQRARGVDGVVVATSVDPSDDPLVAVVEAAGYPVVRGSLHNVLDRFLTVVELLAPQTIIRITADCPLISANVIDRVLSEFEAGDVDYASNTLEPTYPDGLDVEVFRSSAFKRLASLPLDSDEHEHVTLGIYRRPEIFSLLNVADPHHDRSELRWTVDSEADYSFVSGVYAHLFPTHPEFEYEEVLTYVADHPDRSRTGADSLRNAALLGKNTGVMRGPGI